MVLAVFDPHPPFFRPAAGSGFFDSKTSKLLRCWTRMEFFSRSQYLSRRRGAHRAGRAGRGRQGGGLLLAAVQGGRPEIRGGTGEALPVIWWVSASSGRRRGPPRASRSATRRDDPAPCRWAHRGRGAADGAGRKRKQAGRAAWPALPVVLSSAVLSSQRRRGRPAWATLAAICCTSSRFTECRRGTFHGAAGRYFCRAERGIYSPPNGIEKQV